MTPATSSSGSNVSNPCTIAATDRATADASTTRTTGRPRSFDISAVDPTSVVASRPSKSPITPSTIARSASAHARANVARLAFGSSIQPSRV